jgi:CRISPR-associated protein Cas1
VAFLYLTQQGSVLRKTGDRLLIEKDDTILKDLPYHKLDHILVFGNIQITTQAMAELLEKGIPVSLFSSQGHYRGALAPARGKNVNLRLHQFESYKDSTRALNIAKQVVTAKITNALEVLQRLRSHNGGTLDPEDAAPAAAVKAIPSSEFEGRRTNVEASMERAASAASIDELNGHEGVAARDYFTALMMFNKSGVAWPGRMKHPAEDPLNALLSLTYTLLMHECAALLEGVGLDPYLGFLHQLDYGRVSLALDVMEPFRAPVADRLVLRLFNKRVIQADDFERRGENSGLFLKPEPLVRFFEMYEKWMCLRHLQDSVSKPSYRDSLKLCCERLAAALREGKDYQPFHIDEAGDGWNTSSVTI